MPAYGEIVKIFTPLQILQKLNIQSKQCKCKSCSELNFLQKSLWAHKSISLRSGTKGLQKIDIFEIWQCITLRKFILGLNVAKISQYNKKFFKEKWFRIKFPTKKLMDAYVYLPHEWS